LEIAKGGLTSISLLRNGEWRCGTKGMDSKIIRLASQAKAPTREWTLKTTLYLIFVKRYQKRSIPVSKAVLFLLCISPDFRFPEIPKLYHVVFDESYGEVQILEGSSLQIIEELTLS
jgi:hypothetical protein